jgi:sugar-specific transcriptional regulator TrmB
LLESSDLLPLFKQMGLTTYESRMWGALLNVGQADAQQLIHETGVPFGRAYDVLNSLIRKKIVEVQNTRPKIYRPRRSKEVIDRLVRTRKVELDNEMHKFEEAAELAKRQFEHLDKTLPKDEVFVSVALGDKEIQELFRDLVESAEKEILMALPHEDVPMCSPQLIEDAARWLVDRASDGVSVKVLISAPIPPALKIPESEVEKTDGRLQIRAYPGSLNHFKVIDKKYVILEVVEPYEPNTRLVLIQLFSKKLSDHMSQTFARYWRNSLAPRTSLMAESPGKVSLMQKGS